MQKLYVLFGCVVIIGAALLVNPKPAHTNAAMPPAGKTGAPGEGSCAMSGCHTNSSGGSGSVSISYSGGSSYQLDSVYDVSITVNDPTASRYGFQLTALAGGDKAGDLLIVNPVNTSKPTIGGPSTREYIAHKAAGANNTWTFQWRAPSVAMGNVTFYYIGNAANGNNNVTGDRVYTGNLVIGVLSSVASSKASAVHLRVANPATGTLYATYGLDAASDVQASLYDLTGKRVRDVFDGRAAAGHHRLEASLDGMAPGLYMLRLTAGNVSRTTKVVVL